MNEQLVVKNFGPFGEEGADVIFKKVTLLIGPTGSGKSTLAKLASVFREEVVQKTRSRTERKKRYESALEHYSLDEYAHKNSVVEWGSPKGTITVKRTSITVKGWPFVKNGISPSELFIKILKGNMTHYSDAYTPHMQKLIAEKVEEELSSSEDYQNFKKALLSNPHVIYIPAERIFTAIISAALASINVEDITLPRPLLEFCSTFAKAREKLASKKFEPKIFGDFSYRFNNGIDEILTPTGQVSQLNAVASGIQTALPMLLVAEFSRNKPWPVSLVVEEPELNLFPITQSAALHALIAYTTPENYDLTITTHSPYILSSCNLLLEAYKVAQQRPELADEVDKIVPRTCWLNPDEFAAYYVAGGTVKPITDERTHLIGGNELDAVSGDISDSFRRLLQLKKQVA